MRIRNQHTRDLPPYFWKPSSVAHSKNRCPHSWKHSIRQILSWHRSTTLNWASYQNWGNLRHAAFFTISFSNTWFVSVFISASPAFPHLDKKEVGNADGALPFSLLAKGCAWIPSNWILYYIELLHWVLYASNCSDLPKTSQDIIPSACSSTAGWTAEFWLLFLQNWRFLYIRNLHE